MGQEPDFTVTVDQNPFLTTGGTCVEAIVGVRASGAQPGPAGPAAQAAEVIIIDISGSMSGEKLVAAKNAARAALDALRDGTYFALIAGDDRAEVVYPRESAGMVQITDSTRARAKAALRGVDSRGGTIFDPWLLLADKLLGTRPEAIRHAIMLTDGHGSLGNALDACKGHFTCDARGIGGDWSYQQLAKIADALLGSWGIIREPKDMEADFREMIARAMSKAMAEVFLRVRPARGARVRRIQQVAPEIVELTGKAVAADDGRSVDYPLGPWGSEARDYQISVDVDQKAMAMETNNPNPARAALLSVVAPGPGGTTGSGQANILAQASVRIGWTDDLGLSTRIDPVVARYTGQVELSQHVEAGLSALEKHDYAAAERHLGTARRQSRQLNRDDTLVLLNRIVEVVDERTGTVRIRKAVDNKDVIEAVRSATRTVRTKKDREETG